MSFCQPHLERKHVEILATRDVAGTPMCDDCFGNGGEKITPQLTWGSQRAGRLQRKDFSTFKSRYASRSAGMEIVRKVSEACGMDLDHVLSGQWERPAIHARQVSLFILRHHLNWSYKACGKLFHQHHSTALYAVLTVEKRIAKYSKQRAEIGKLYKQATGQDL